MSGRIAHIILEDRRTQEEENALRMVFEDKDKVDIVLLRRGVEKTLRLASHWAWFIKSSKMYTLIDYGNTGIIIHIFSGDSNPDEVAKCMMGNGNISHDTKYTTEKNLDDILQTVVRFQKIYNKSEYHSLKNNCQHFARALGREMNPQFNEQLQVYEQKYL